MKVDPKDVPEIKFGKSALELLDSRYAEPPSVASEYGIQTCIGLMGAGCHGLRNWTYRRPVLAGKILLTKLIIFSVIFTQNETFQ